VGPVPCVFPCSAHVSLECFPSPGSSLRALRFLVFDLFARSFLVWPRLRKQEQCVFVPRGLVSQQGRGVPILNFFSCGERWDSFFMFFRRLSAGRFLITFSFPCHRPLRDNAMSLNTPNLQILLFQYATSLLQVFFVAHFLRFLPSFQYSLSLLAR